MKRCTKCKLIKSYEHYHRDRHAKDGYYPSCISCNMHRRNNPLKKAQYDKEYRKRNSWRKKAWNYDVTVQFLLNLLIEQDYKCAICKQVEVNRHSSGAFMHLSIDHCHKTRKVRGFLCQKCNQGLGLFRDDPSLLKAAASYLESDHRWVDAV